MPDKRGRPNLSPPRHRGEVMWSESTVAWHAMSEASNNRWRRTLCGSRLVEPLYGLPADENPDGPPWNDHRRVCDRCADRVARLPGSDKPEHAR